jgi:hypothetical protein
MGSASFSPHNKKSFCDWRGDQALGLQNAPAHRRAAARFPQETHLGQAGPAVRNRGFAGLEGLRLAARSTEPDLLSALGHRHNHAAALGAARPGYSRAARSADTGRRGSRRPRRRPASLRKCLPASALTTGPARRWHKAGPSSPGGGDNSPGSGAETSGKGGASSSRVAEPAPPLSAPACLHSLSGPPRRLACPGLAHAAGRWRRRRTRTRTRAVAGSWGWNAAAVATAAPASLAQLYDAGGGGPAEGAGQGRGLGGVRHARNKRRRRAAATAPRSHAHAPLTLSDTPLAAGGGNLKETVTRTALAVIL